MNGTRSVSVDADFPIRPYRVAALACVAALTLSVVAVVYHVVSVVGGVSVLVPLVAGAVGLAVVMRALPERVAAGLAVVMFVAGLAVYVAVMPDAYAAALSANSVFRDTIALLTGFSVLRMTEAGAWSLAVIPGPVFLTWYFALRGNYAPSVAIGGFTLGFFVLTGDSGTVGTLVGVLAAFGALGFGRLDVHRARRRQVEVLAAVLAVAVLASATVSAVPGSGSPLVPPSATAPGGSLVVAGERVGVGGSISLSPKVQFVVEADEEAYWRAGVYDRFTGQGWVRTSAPSADSGYDRPPGPTKRVRQRVTAKRSLGVMPAAAAPIDVSGEDYELTAFGNPQPSGSLGEGESYSVVSAVSDATVPTLQRAGTKYPDDITSRYLQLPESTSKRVGALTANITSGAETPYQKANAIESWLETHKSYSLSVPRPDGNIVNQFLFEQTKGYCVYYASAMTTMLRTQGIPARYVVGYTPGQQVSDDEWVVRGVDSHAWVEVYFPDVGWVRFDPTPGSVRQTTEDQVVEDARSRGVDGVDAAGSADSTYTPTTTTTTTPEDDDRTGTRNGTVRLPRDALGGHLPNDPTTGNASNVTDPAVGAGGPETGGSDGNGVVPDVPPETVAVWTVLVGGMLAGIHRFGLAKRAYRVLWVHTTPRGTPAERVTGAFDRAEYVLARHHRPRRNGETITEYLDAIRADRRATELAAIRERAVYADDTGDEDAARATELAAAIVSEYGRLPRIHPSTVFNRALS